MGLLFSSLPLKGSPLAQAIVLASSWVPSFQAVPLGSILSVQSLLSLCWYLLPYLLPILCCSPLPSSLVFFYKWVRALWCRGLGSCSVKCVEEMNKWVRREGDDFSGKHPPSVVLGLGPHLSYLWMFSIISQSGLHHSEARTAVCLKHSSWFECASLCGTAAVDWWVSNLIAHWNHAQEFIFLTSFPAITDVVGLGPTFLEPTPKIFQQL